MAEYKSRYKYPTTHGYTSTVLVFILILLSSCKDLGFQALDMNTKQFDGIKSINLTPDGRYVLVWDFVGTNADVNAHTYEIYMAKLTAMPNGTGNLTQEQRSDDTGIKALASQVVYLPDEQSPVQRGSLIASVKGVRNYTLEEKILPESVYAFQIRVIDGSGARDTNERVLVYSPALSKLVFSGVSKLELSPTGSLLVHWIPPTDSVAASDVTYDIYMDAVTDTVDVATEGAMLLDPQPVTATPEGVGQVYDFPETNLLPTRVAIFAEKKGGRYFELTNELAAGRTYLFQVIAQGPNGELGHSSRVAVYRKESFKFEGLKDDGVAIAADRSKITLHWTPPEGANGDTSYLIYEDADFTKILAKTNTPAYEFNNPVEGQSYIFGVRAKVGRSIDDNREFVVVKMPLTPGKPVFNGLLSANTDSDGYPLLKWEAASDRITPPSAITYNIYRSTSPAGINYQTPAASVTGSVIYKDTNVSWGNTYYYAVRAGNAHGLFEENIVQKSAQPMPPLLFDGIQSAVALSSSRVQLSWEGASGAVGALLYKIYQNGNLNTPIAVTTKTSHQVAGLAASTTYGFTVKASDSARKDDDSGSGSLPVTTLDAGYPDFAGVKTLTPIAGIAGQTKLTATWTSAVPATDTALASYHIYVATSPGGQDFSTPTFSTGLTAYTLSGLTPNTMYYVVVRAAASNGFIDQNTVELAAATAAVQPVSFAGIQTATIGLGSAGFNTVLLSWYPGTGTFDQYQVFMRQAQEVFDFNSPVKVITDLSQTGVTLTAQDGIPSNKALYFIVRAVNSTIEEQDDYNLNEKFITTSPARPSFAGIVSAELPSGVVGLTNVDISWMPASGTFNTYGVFRRYPNGGGALTYDFSLNQAGTGFAGSYNTINGSLLTARVPGLVLNQEVCFAVRAFWNDGTNFLVDDQSPIKERCITPTLAAPVFGGVISAVVNSNHPTTSIDIAWAEASGIFDHYEIYFGRSASEALDIASDPLTPCPTAISNCRHTGISPAVTSQTITGFSPGQIVYVYMRAGYHPTNIADPNTVTTSVTLNSLAGLILAWVVQPNGTFPGLAMPVQPQVKLIDNASGAIVTGISGTVNLVVSSGEGSVSGGTANLNSATGIASFANARFLDSDANSPQPFQLIATMTGVTNSAPSNAQRNAVGACSTHSETWMTADGGCKHIPTGYVFSRESATSMTWHDAIKGCFSGTNCDLYDGEHGTILDTTPGSGYCADLVEGGQSDWRVPTIGEFLSLQQPKPPLRAGAGRPSATYWWMNTVGSTPLQAYTFNRSSGTGYGSSIAKSSQDTAQAACVRGP